MFEPEDCYPVTPYGVAAAPRTEQRWAKSALNRSCNELLVPSGAGPANGPNPDGHDGWLSPNLPILLSKIHNPARTAQGMPASHGTGGLR
jgi:hypothetical protein